MVGFRKHVCGTSRDGFGEEKKQSGQKSQDSKLLPAACALFRPVSVLKTKPLRASMTKVNDSILRRVT
jgi:hypothetical protein